MTIELILYSIISGILFSFINLVIIYLNISKNNSKISILSNNVKTSLRNTLFWDIIFYPISESLILTRLIDLLNYFNIKFEYILIIVFTVSFFAHKHSNIYGRILISCFFISMSIQYNIINEHQTILSSLFLVTISHSSYNGCLLVFPFIYDKVNSIFGNFYKKNKLNE